MTYNYIYRLKYRPVCEIRKNISFWNKNTDSFGNKDWKKDVYYLQAHDNYDDQWYFKNPKISSKTSEVKKWQKQ